MRMAWYKEGHEITPRDIAEDTAQRALRAIDTHDLLALADFWRKEISTLEAVGKPLPQDLALARDKLRLYKTEINRRNNLL